MREFEVTSTVMSNSNSALANGGHARYQRVVARLKMLNGSRFINVLSVLDPKI